MLQHARAPLLLKFLFSPKGEGNGNPLQYSCLENPVTEEPGGLLSKGVAQSQTRLKRLSMRACIGEGNGNPLQCSCLENPRDREAQLAAVYGVAQGWTWLKQLSSSSSSILTQKPLPLWYFHHLVPVVIFGTLQKKWNPPLYTAFKIDKVLSTSSCHRDESKWTDTCFKGKTRTQEQTIINGTIRKQRERDLISSSEQALLHKASTPVSNSEQMIQPLVSSWLQEHLLKNHILNIQSC